MRKVAILAIVFLSALIFFNSSTVKAQTKKEHNKKEVITIKHGDSLSKIAKKHKTTYKRIFYANKKIKDPNLIFPGQKIRIPSKKEKLRKRPLGAQVKQIAPKIKSEVSQPIKKISSPEPNYASGNSVWDRLAMCESGGNWAINTGNGFYGGLQFTLSSWQAVGGSGYPNQASREEQIKRGKMLQARGGWGNWPACSAKLGLI